jgi:flagellar protein FlaI
MLKVRLRILKKPDIDCDVSYEFDNYGVCIKEDRYYVYDKVSEDPNVEVDLASIEDKLLNMLISEELTPEEILTSIEEKYRYIVVRQYYGYGILDPLFKDPDIVDIHIVLGQPAQVVHRKYGRLVTNVELVLDELQELVLRMASSAGKVISEATPVVSFIEPRYEARVTTTYYSDITLRRGMTVDIRKQPSKPWTMLKLIDLGTVSVEEAAYLWLMIKYKVPILIVGELMSGKTTLSNALLNLVPPDSRVITIEDAPELKVYVPYWTRTTIRESEVNPITIFNILKVAMRITADYIVVGEIRGEEAREWAQGILLGHGGLSSFHAESPEAALLRLKTPPIEVNPQALKLLNIFVKMIPIRSSATMELVRRSEVYIYEDDKFTLLFKYDPESDKIVLNKEAGDPLGFKFLDRVSIAHGVPRNRLQKEYEAMKKVLEEVYHEAKEKDPELESPDYRELPIILYRKLEEVLKA